MFDLVLFRTYADLRAEVARTYLGFLWWLLEPLMFLGVFYLVFGVLRGRGDAGYIGFLLVGLMFWQWFRSGVSHASDSIRNNLSLLKQVHVPVAVLPLSVILTDTVKFGFVLVVLFPLLWSLGFSPSFALLELLPLILAAFFLVLGIGIAFAVVIPFFPDIRFILETLLMLLMFLSGVFFDIAEVQSNYHSMILWNPVARLLIDARKVMLDGGLEDWSGVAYVVAWGVMTVLLSGTCAMRFQRRYAKLGN